MEHGQVSWVLNAQVMGWLSNHPIETGPADDANIGFWIPQFERYWLHFHSRSCPVTLFRASFFLYLLLSFFFLLSQMSSLFGTARFTPGRVSSILQQRASTLPFSYSNTRNFSASNARMVVEQLHSYVSPVSRNSFALESSFLPPPPPSPHPTHNTSQRNIHRFADYHLNTREDAFNKAIADEGKSAVIVDFFAKWCGPCKTIAPTVIQLSNSSENAKIGFYKVDIDEVDKVARAQEVRAMPSFFAYKGGQKDGEVVGANIGALTQLLKKYQQQNWIANHHTVAYASLTRVHMYHA